MSRHARGTVAQLGILGAGRVTARDTIHEFNFKKITQRLVFLAFALKNVRHVQRRESKFNFKHSFCRSGRTHHFPPYSLRP
jgi:hypothetical protein